MKIKGKPNFTENLKIYRVAGWTCYGGGHGEGPQESYGTNYGTFIDRGEAEDKAQEVRMKQNYGETVQVIEETLVGKVRRVL